MMTNEDSHPEQDAELRKRAEATAQEKAVHPPEDQEALSPDDARQALHELRVHQIELEMQNEELRRVQEALTASQARFFDLYDLAPIGYVTLSEQGLILEANFKAAALLGVPRSALVQQPFSRFLLPEDQDRYYQYRKILFATGDSQACDLRVGKPDGTHFWAHLAATVAPDVSDTLVCRLALSDITERKFQEDERELTARLILLVNTPGEFRDRMAALTASLQGWSGCEAVGIRLRAGDDYPYYETRGFPPAFVHEETRLCATGPDGTILRDGVGNPVIECMCGNILCGRFDPSKPFFTPRGSFWSNNTTALLASTTEADRQARTRNRCNGEGYESVALIPLRNDQQVFGLLQFNDHRPNRFTPDLIAHFENLADSLAIALARRQAEEALRESEERFTLSMEATNDGLWDWNITTDTGYFSPEYYRMLGHEVGAFPAKGIVWQDLIHPDDRAHALRTNLDCIEGRRDVFEIEYRMKAATGGWRWILGRGKCVARDAQGRGLRLVGTHVDITERKRAEEEKATLEAQLRQAQKMESVGRLAGGVAHDFNNMLSVILGHVELALMQVDPTQPLHGDLEEIRSAAERSADLTRQLLAFARKQIIAPKVLDLNATVESMLTMLRRLIGENLQLTWQPGAGLWPVKMDPSQIDQILANLCVNARAAIADVGRITLETGNVVFDETYCATHPGCVPGEYVQLTVRDTGAGMDPDTLSHLFEPFFTTKDVGAGTGLGLATVYGIITQNHGCITVDSAVGRGTTFTLSLPRHVGTAGQALAAGPADPALLGHETILLVEDEPAILTLTTRMLEMQGYTVLAAATPGEALRLAEAHPDALHLLLTDVVMPEMNGRALAKALRARYPDLKHLFMSGYTADVIAHHDVLETGVAFIQKPFSLHALAAKVRKVLEREEGRGQ